MEKQKPIFDVTQNDIAQDNNQYTGNAWAYPQPQMSDMDQLRAFAANLPINHNRFWSRDR